MLSALFVETDTSIILELFVWLYCLLSHQDGDGAHLYLPSVDWDKLSAVMPSFLQEIWGPDSGPHAYNERSI